MTIFVSSTAPNFQFVRNDVQKQLEISRQLLGEIERLNEFANNLPPERAAELRSSMTRLLDIVNQINNNVAVTSANVSSTITSTSCGAREKQIRALAFSPDRTNANLIFLVSPVGKSN